MKRSYKFNLFQKGSTSRAAAIGIGSAAAVLTPIVLGINYWIKSEDEEREQLQTHRQVRFNMISGSYDNYDYRLSGDASLLRYGGNVNYEYDFQDNVVVINQNGGDRILTFDEYASPEAIEEARKAGCEITDAFNGKKQSAQKNYGIHPYTDHASWVKAFETNVCP